MDKQRSIELADLLGRVGIVIYFGWGAIGKIMAVVRMIADWPVHADMQQHLALTSQLASLGLTLAMVGLTVFRFKPARRAEGIESRFSALGGAFLLLALLFVPDTIEVPQWLQVAGLMVATVGCAASIWVIRWLGRSFSIMAEARNLVTGGPYSLIRHPLYLTEEIAVVGFAMLHLSPMAIVILVLHWVLQLRRMHNEEQVLTAAFPEYANYAATTPRLIPHFWAKTQYSQ